MKIVITGDLRREETEDFRITFTPITPDVFKDGINSVVALIVDDSDRKLLFFYYMFPMVTPPTLLTSELSVGDTLYETFLGELNSFYIFICAYNRL